MCRYALPCRHILHRATKDGLPIPLSLIHPRWWLDGPPTAPSGWKMEYCDATTDPSLRHENLSLYHDGGEKKETAEPKREH